MYNQDFCKIHHISCRDPSEEFAFSSFFPEILRPVIDPVATIFKRGTLWKKAGEYGFCCFWHVGFGFAIRDDDIRLSLSCLDKVKALPYLAQGAPSRRILQGK